MTATADAPKVPKELIDDLRSISPDEILDVWKKLPEDKQKLFYPQLTRKQRAKIDGTPEQPQQQQKEEGVTAQGQSQGHRKDWFKPLSQAVFFCFGIVAVWVCFLNIQPYVRVTEILLGIAGQLAILRLLLAIPILGGIIEWIGSVAIPVIGFAIWAIIQYFELLPDLIKQHINKVTPAALKRAGTYRGWTYAIDLMLCIICFPPIKGGMNGFFMFLASPSFQDLDWWNILYIVVTMFAVEALWKAYQWLQELLRKIG